MLTRYAFVIGALFIFAILCSPSRAATLEDSARADAEVVLYSSLNNEQIVTLVEAFRKKYPSIKPSFYRGTSERVLQRAFTEAKAGRFAVDVATSAGFQVQLMKDSGLTQRFIPPEASLYEEGFKDPDGHWVNVHSLLNSMAYTPSSCVQTKRQRDTKICWRRVGRAVSASIFRIRNGT